MAINKSTKAKAKQFAILTLVFMGGQFLLSTAANRSQLAAKAKMFINTGV